MRQARRTLLAAALLAVPAPAAQAREVYVANSGSDNVSVFDAATNTPVAGSPFATGGTGPDGVAVNPDGTRVYVANGASNNVSVFDAATNTPVAGSPFATGGTNPTGVAVCPAVVTPPTPPTPPTTPTSPASPAPPTAVVASPRFTG